MKVNVEIECTPEEARRAMGLPDLTPLHDRYVTMMLEAMSGGFKPETMEQLTRNWGPMGEASMTLWQRLVETGMGKAGSGKTTD
ncbi:hypothetical protein SAMN05192583_3024 [Sphingomonas gellani]|uniref:Uncharacterized protein n=1 Tax=Sphingomonas gellani TaxID=1166340 RepID=A0A1H8HEK7_9SPHN|nr:DUF6489 family protein [Sphingomonas gellani]SEN54545.1 hypothetical protein SAMN05192583_3024 [Sphingomonas gellani]